MLYLWGSCSAQDREGLDLSKPGLLFSTKDVQEEFSLLELLGREAEKPVARPMRKDLWPLEEEMLWD